MSTPTQHSTPPPAAARPSGPAAAHPSVISALRKPAGDAPRSTAPPIVPGAAKAPFVRPAPVLQFAPRPQRAAASRGPNATTASAATATGADSAVGAAAARAAPITAPVVPALVGVGSAGAEVAPHGTKRWIDGSLLVSTGCAPIDGILGGGLAVGSMCLIEADMSGIHSDTLLQLFCAEGLACGHRLVLAGTASHAASGDSSSSRHSSSAATENAYLWNVLKSLPHNVSRDSKDLAAAAAAGEAATAATAHASTAAAAPSHGTEDQWDSTGTGLNIAAGYKKYLAPGATNAVGLTGTTHATKAAVPNTAAAGHASYASAPLPPQPVKYCHTFDLSRHVHPQTLADSDITLVTLGGTHAARDAPVVDFWRAAAATGNRHGGAAPASGNASPVKTLPKTGAASSSSGGGGGGSSAVGIAATARRGSLVGAAASDGSASSPGGSSLGARRPSFATGTPAPPVASMRMRPASAKPLPLASSAGALGVATTASSLPTEVTANHEELYHSLYKQVTAALTGREQASARVTEGTGVTMSTASSSKNTITRVAITGLGSAHWPGFTGPTHLAFALTGATAVNSLGGSASSSAGDAEFPEMLPMADAMNAHKSLLSTLGALRRTVVRRGTGAGGAVVIVVLPTHLLPASVAAAVRAPFDTVLKVHGFTDAAYGVAGAAGARGGSGTAPEYVDYNGLLLVRRLLRTGFITGSQPDCVTYVFRRDRRKFVVEKPHLPPEDDRTATAPTSAGGTGTASTAGLGAAMRMTKAAASSGSSGSSTNRGAGMSADTFFDSLPGSSSSFTHTLASSSSGMGCSAGGGGGRASGNSAYDF